MKTYLEIAISANEHQRELLIPTMVELGCQGFQETDSALLCYLDKTRWTSAQYESFQDDIQRTLRIITANAVVHFQEIQEENWNRQWEQTIQPIEIGKRLVIKPSWCSYNNDGGRIIIRIDPKMSFGTGFHESTRIILRLLETYLTANVAVLDVGTGTGILAIAAIKLGAASAYATDIDDWSISNAQENVNANGVANEVTISTSALHQFTSTSIDLLTANLTLNTNIELLGEFRRILRTSGIVLLSGLLIQDRSTMRKHLLENHLEVIDEVGENEWIAIAARKTA